MSTESPWWRFWDCDIHRSCSSVQHALIAAAAMGLATIGAVESGAWVTWVVAVAITVAFGAREEMQMSGFWGRRHLTERGKWDARRDWLYPTVVAMGWAVLVEGWL